MSVMKNKTIDAARSPLHASTISVTNKRNNEAINGFITSRHNNTSPFHDDFLNYLYIVIRRRPQEYEKFAEPTSIYLYCIISVTGFLKEPKNEKNENGFTIRVSELRQLISKVAGQVSRMRELEHIRRGKDGESR